MNTCQHQWRFVGKKPHGEDRVIHTWKCSLCPKTRTRNLKKPRFVPYVELLELKGTKSRKQAKTSQKPRKPLKKRSDKRKAQEVEYSKLRKVFLEEHPICQVCHSEASDQIHHTMGREQGWLLKTEHFLAVCGDCHHFIETNREEAVKRGYLKLRLTTDQLKDHGT